MLHPIPPERYSAGLTREQFLFYESRICAGLLMQGFTHEEALRKISEENLFQFPTDRMVASIAKTCLRRLDTLNSEPLVGVLAQGSISEAKQINLYAMMCDNRIVWDFMTEVIGEKFRTGDVCFSKADVGRYLFLLQERIPAAAQWSDATFAKIRQVLVKCLVECEYLDSPRAQRLNPVQAGAALEEVLRMRQNRAALAAFCCFSE